MPFLQCIPSSNVHLFDFVRNCSDDKKNSVHIFFSFWQMEFFCHIKFYYSRKFGSTAQPITDSEMHHCWQKQYHLETLGSGIPLLMLLSSAFTFFFGPKKAQFIMNAASRKEIQKISEAKTLSECLILFVYFYIVQYTDRNFVVEFDT